MKQRWRFTQWLMVVLPVLIGILGLLILPERIPSHFNGAWEITRWGSKYESLILAGIFFLINLALLLVCKAVVPKLKRQGEKRLVLWTSYAGMLVLDVVAVALLCVTGVSARNIPLVSKLPVIEAEENLLSYEKGRWPLFYRTPESVGEPHPFDGNAAFNAFEADLSSDGQYEAYATIHFGSGIVNSYLLGYDPVSGSTYTLNKRGAVDYEFAAYEGELFVHATPFFVQEGNETGQGKVSEGIYRPKLNDETMSIGLEEIDPDLAAAIQGDMAQKIS